MIFHLLHYLQQQFPKFDPIIPEGQVTGDPQERIIIRSVPGTVAGYPLNRRDDQVQVKVFHKDQREAYDRAEAIFQYIREKHGVIWEPHPEDVEKLGSAVGPIRIARVASLQSPHSLGRQEDGTALYLFNVIVTWAG